MSAGAKPGMCFNITAEMMEAYKVKILADGFPFVDVPTELLVWLIDRAQAWERLAHDERVHHGESL